MKEVVSGYKPADLKPPQLILLYKKKLGLNNTLGLPSYVHM